MRRAAPVFSGILLAAAGGLALAAVGATPALALIAGVLVLALAATVFAVSGERLAFGAVSLFVLTVTWNGLRVAGHALGDIPMALAFAAVVIDVLGSRRPLTLPPWLLLAALACLLSGLLNVIFPPGEPVVQRSVLAETTLKVMDGAPGLASVPSNGLELFEYELSLLVTPLVIVAAGRTPRRCLRLIGLWTLGAVINGLAGVLDYAHIAHLGGVPFTDNRSAGLTVQSNYLALTCVLAIPTAMLWFGRSRRANVSAALGLAALLGGVYSSGSRAGTVAALIAVVGTIALTPRLRPALRWVAPVGGMALVALLVLTNTGRAIINQIRLGSSASTSVSTSFSDYQRSLVANVAWSQIKARPISGVGFSVIANAHDIYLELLDAGGAFALAGFAVFIGGLGASLRRALAGALRDEAVALGIAIFAWLANGVFDNQVADKYLYVVPGLLAAVALLCGARSPAAGPQRPVRWPAGRSAMPERLAAPAVAAPALPERLAAPAGGPSAWRAGAPAQAAEVTGGLTAP